MLFWLKLLFWSEAIRICGYFCHSTTLFTSSGMHLSLGEYFLAIVHVLVCFGLARGHVLSRLRHRWLSSQAVKVLLLLCCSNEFLLADQFGAAGHASSSQNKVARIGVTSFIVGEVVKISIHHRHQGGSCALDLADGVQEGQGIVRSAAEACWVTHAHWGLNEVLHEWHGVGMLQTRVVLTWHWSVIDLVITAGKLAILLEGISSRNFILKLLDGSSNLVGRWLALVELACDHVLLTGSSDISVGSSLGFILILLIAEDFVTLMVNLWKI